MEKYLDVVRNELIWTVIVLSALIIVRVLVINAIHKVGKVSDLNKARTRMISKYISYGLLTITAIFLILIWGVNIKELGILLSSIFAVIGVALFAQWSILSNVSAGIILFFSYPFKIGDRIKIIDKDSEYKGEYLIEDIRAYHLNLRNELGEMVTYPNSLILQKAIILTQNTTNGIDDSDVL